MSELLLAVVHLSGDARAYLQQLDFYTELARHARRAPTDASDAELDELLEAADAARSAVALLNDRATALLRSDKIV